MGIQTGHAVKADPVAEWTNDRAFGAMGRAHVSPVDDQRFEWAKEEPEVGGRVEWTTFAQPGTCE